MTINGATYDKRNRAGLRLLLVIGKEMAAVTRNGHPRSEARPGHLGGFDVTVSAQRILGTTQVVLALEGAPGSDVRLTGKDLAETDATGLIIRLENRLTGLEAVKTKALTDIEHLKGEIAHAHQDTRRAFPQTAQLISARLRVREIEEELEEAAKSQHIGSQQDLLAVGSARTKSANTNEYRFAVGKGRVAAMAGTAADQVVNVRTGSEEDNPAVLTARDFPEESSLADPASTPPALPHRVHPYARSTVHRAL